VREFSVGWWEGVARAIFGYQEHKPLQLDDAIRAVAVFEMDRIEWGFLKNEHYFWTPFLAQGALAGEFGYIALRNPLGSGVLAIIDGVHMAGATTNDSEMRLGFTGTGFDASIAVTSKVGTVLDTRLLTEASADGARPACDQIQGNATAAERAFLTNAFGFFQQNNINPSSATIAGLTGRPWQVVLAPGTLAAVLSVVVAGAASLQFRWREKPLHKGVRA